MSQALLDKAIETAWQHWTVLGVAGVAPPPVHAIDLEALIAFTPFIAADEPRLERECLDWCVRIGPPHVSISRLKHVARWMPTRKSAHVVNLVDVVLAGDGLALKLSKKSRPPRLEHPSLVKLRSRRIFGVGARADVIVALAMRPQNAEAVRISAMRVTGYTKRAIANVVDDLASVGVLEKLIVDQAPRYRLTQRATLRALLQPMPKRAPSWSVRFGLVALCLETWRSVGARSTYAVELVKVLDKVRPWADATEPMPRFVGRASTVLIEAERWAMTLLEPTPRR